MIQALLNHLLDIKFLNYLKMGVFNTLASLLIIYLLLFAEVNPYISNAIGYAYGVMQSFYLNKTYVFSVSKVTFAHYKNFLFAFIVSYISNIIVLWFLIDLLYMNIYLSQFICMGIYAVIFFLILKLGAFHSE
jgi:putative flippase GtrA